ncbi:MAG: hypothetical protein ACUVR4_03075 [Anaerolineae bacterium]
MADERAAPPYPAAVAASKFDRLQSRRLIPSLLRLFSQKPDETLLSFDQVQELLRSRQEIDRGIQTIPISHIVGSVGRYRDFDRAFLPLDGADEERWKRLDVALNELRNLPPIEVYKIGDVYFVRDGNHRVSVAKANGLTHIDAHVTEIETRVPLTPNVDVDDLIIKAEYAQFLAQTKLDETRPDQQIELTEPGRYRILLEHIEVHRYYLGLLWNREPTLEEAAASWYDTVYLPIIQAIQESGVLKEFPKRTAADLYLWIAYHRERLKERYGVMPPDREVAAALAEQFSDRPIARLVKTVARAISAAVKAASEMPEPPLTPPPSSSTAATE